MPHINIKCYPKGLSDSQLQAFADELTAFVSQRLDTPAEYITIDYTEIPADDWKERVFDPEIKARAGELLREPQYEM